MTAWSTSSSSNSTALMAWSSTPTKTPACPTQRSPHRPQPRRPRAFGHRVKVGSQPLHCSAERSPGTCGRRPRPGGAASASSSPRLNMAWVRLASAASVYQAGARRPGHRRPPAAPRDGTSRRCHRSRRPSLTRCRCRPGRRHPSATPGGQASRRSRRGCRGVRDGSAVQNRAYPASSRAVTRPRRIRRTEGSVASRGIRAAIEILATALGRPGCQFVDFLRLGEGWWGRCLAR